jgi:MFS family permease
VRSLVTAKSPTTTVSRSGPGRNDDGSFGDMSTIDGPRGWLTVVAAFISLYTVFGVAYSFSGFFGSMADEFGIERSATAFFFALTTFFYFGLGIVTGRVADRIGPRPVLLFGTGAMVVGLLATSQVTNLYVGYATYSLGVGIAVACGYVPMVAAVGGWFLKKRATALGLAVAGIGVGTLVNAPFAEWLIDRYGWRQTYQIMAVGAGALMLLSAALIRRPPTVSAADTPPLRSLISGSPAFWLLYASMMVMSFPLFMPFVFMSDYLAQEGSTGSAGFLLGLIGLSSVLGRLGLGSLASRVPVMKLYQGSILVLALSFLIWFAAGSSYGTLLGFAVVMGISYGGFIALAPAVVAETFGPVGLGGVLGALYTAAGFGGLVGPPTMGFFIDQVGYRSTVLIALGLGMVAAVTLMPLNRRPRAA